METASIEIGINANGMEPGLYESKIVVHSISTEHRDTVDVQLTVEDATVALDGVSIPIDFHLAQNYPNPFNPKTNIHYSIPHLSNVKIIIYDIIGRAVLVLSNTQQEAGYYNLSWDGTNELGAMVSAGIYFYAIQASDFRQTKKMILLK
jgi:flagellar hook assembly protein FlgD